MVEGDYVYKWRGRYYVYHNHHFSYPSVLGITLVKAIPAHPDRYYKWLEQKRAEYTAIEQQSEKTIFTVSPTQAQYGRVTPLVSSGLENLKCLPIYIGPPGCNSSIRWVYVIDLDREIFHVCGDDYFCLSKITENWFGRFREAQIFHTRAARRALRPWATKTSYHVGSTEHGITSPILPPSKEHKNGTSAYLDLNPSFVVPMQSPIIDNRPIINIARLSFDVLLEDYSQLV